MTRRPDKSSLQMASVFNNLPLATALHRSIDQALIHDFVRLTGGKSVWQVFDASLKASIRDIKNHPRGNLFSRLIKYGPHNPDDPRALTSDGKRMLSDPECGKTIEFIFSHMVNRFKGELAELLALEPCISMFEQFRKEGRLPENSRLYWGETVQEQCFSNGLSKKRWGKGADGLFAEVDASRVQVHGVVEVKSMSLGAKRILGQIEHHLFRLTGGIRIEGREYSQELFHRTIAGFLQHVHKQTLRPAGRISASAALDEAISILERDYHGMQASGYYGALLDAADLSQAGIELVLARLAELVKTRRRQIYVRWVAARNIDPTDWRTKCALATMLIRQCRNWMPSELKRCPAEQLADYLPELLQLHMSTEVSAAINFFEQIFQSI